MKKKKRKLKSEDILLNSSVEINHTIQRIKKHEKRYTTILVIFFLSIFLLLGYRLIMIDSSDASTIIYGDEVEGLVSQGEVISLTDSSIMSDTEGKKSNPYTFRVSNRNFQTSKYQILLNIDDSIDTSPIRYSIDDKVYSVMGNHIVLFSNELLVGGDERTYQIRVWLDKSTKKQDNLIKGYFSLTETK